ncbi:hypothetical protein HY311_03875 [Candidatus Nomurabacteria bacterium]|nr:hypothetical protein [Candidatus Nomurabacteria bacterium]
MEPKNNSQKNIAIALVAVAIAAVLSVPIFLGKKTTTLPSAPLLNQGGDGSGNSTPVVSKTPPVDVPKKTLSVYKDGTYTATGSYDSPGGMDKVTVTLTLKSDVVTDVSVTPIAGDSLSKKYQDMFVSGYKQFVVGQKIAGLQLSKVSGSSLTPIGFNAALTQIKAQAKA